MSQWPLTQSGQPAGGTDPCLPRQVIPLWKALATNSRLARKVITLLYMKLKLRPPRELIKVPVQAEFVSLLVSPSPAPQPLQWSLTSGGPGEARVVWQRVSLDAESQDGASSRLAPDPPQGPRAVPVLLQALGTIYELLYIHEYKATVRWAFAGILLGLLTQLHYLFELDVVEGMSDYQEEALEAKALSPCR